MEAVKLEKNILKLPNRIANKLKGKRIEITEMEEGILLKTGSNPITEARGFLKGSRFSTNRYLEMKKVEKELE